MIERETIRCLLGSVWTIMIESECRLPGLDLAESEAAPAVGLDGSCPMFSREGRNPALQPSPAVDAVWLLFAGGRHPAGYGSYRGRRSCSCQQSAWCVESLCPCRFPSPDR